MKFLTSLPSLATRSSIVYQRWTHEKKRTLQPLRLLLFCQIFGANKPIRTKLKWPFGSLLTHWVYSLYTVNATKKYILKGVNILHKGVACCTQENVSSQNWNFWERSEYLAIRRPPMLVHFPTHDHRRNSLCKLGHEGIVTLRSYRKLEFRISSIRSQLAQIFQNCH